MPNQAVSLTNYDSQLAEAQRRQKLAELLQQQADQPLDVQSYKGVQAPVSNAAGLAKLLNSFMASYEGNRADTDLQTADTSARADAANSAHDMFFQPSQGYQAQNPDEVSVTPQTVGGIAPTSNGQQLAAALAGGGSSNPYTRQMSGAALPGIMATQAQANQPITPYQQAELGNQQRQFDAGRSDVAASRDRQAKIDDPKYQGEVAGARAAAELPSQIKLAGVKADASLKQQLGDANDLQSMATAIAKYQMAPLSGFAMTKPAGQAIMGLVTQINPQYNAQNFTKSQQAYKSFGTGKQGDIVRSFNVGISHLDTMSDLTDALQNGNVQTINAVANRVKSEFGNTAPTNFNAAKAIVGDEIIKAIVGGGGALADRENAQNQIAAANTPAQLKGVIATYQKLMAGQLMGLKQQYEQATMRDDFNSLLADKTISKLESGGTSQPDGAAQTKTINGVTYHFVNGQWMK